MTREEFESLKSGDQIETYPGSNDREQVISNKDGLITIFPCQEMDKPRKIDLNTTFNYEELKNWVKVVAIEGFEI